MCRPFCFLSTFMAGAQICFLLLTRKSIQGLHPLSREWKRPPEASGPDENLPSGSPSVSISGQRELASR